MLTDAPWAFSASDTPSAPMTAPTGLELVAAAGIRRLQGSKSAHRAQLWGVFVEPAQRGRGLGRRVVVAAIARARGWPGVDYVDLGVSEQAPEARHLYESLGFRPWGREPESTCVGDRRYDEIYMTLRL
jgi:ribosomal protein S18 acetylase RimI-like enzyme